MRQSLALAILLVILAFTCGSAAAQTTCPTGAGTAAHIAAIQGDVRVIATDARNNRPAQAGGEVCYGEVVQTGADSRANIVLGSSDAITQLDQNTRLTVGCTPSNPSLDLLQGIIHIFTHQDNGLQVCTQFVNAGIRGTEFLVETRTADYPSSTRLTVLEGTVGATAAGQTTPLAVPGGDFAVFGAGAPTVQVDVRQRDRLQWTLYYPPLLIGNEPGLPQSLRDALTLRRQGRFTEALARVGAARDRQSAIVKGELLLAVGRYDQLQAALAAGGAAGTPEGLGLLAVAALAQGRTADALNLACEAASGKPLAAGVAPSTACTPVPSTPAAASIALSYAIQATGDQEGAQSILSAAIQVHPQDGLLFARLAEVLLSLDQRSKALDAANQAVMLAPQLGRAISVRGFADLAVAHIADARSDFQTALLSEPHDPLNWLGLGLTIIRQGDLADGLQDLEIAKSVDPGNSLVASYLGKGYDQAKNDNAAARELNIAKQLDPNDPTPYLYDAVRKQNDNQPVGALYDIETSIQLNDNRAVYRSRFLLDEDLAVRNANAASIYQDLGFQQPALVEAYKSLAADPSNFSAHRFLADSYLTSPLSQFGHDSELLQAQLLQPININPVEPQLAGDQSPSPINSFGPSNVTFSEFSPLFQSNGWRVTTEGVAGSQDTVADDAAFSAIFNNLSVAASQYHFQTDGFRANDDTTENISDGFAQYAFDDRTSVEVELRNRERQRGDVAQYFYGFFSPGNRDDFDVNTERVGARHEFAPGYVLIASYIHRGQTESNTDPPFFADNSRDSADFGEVRQLAQGPHWSLTFGGGVFRGGNNDVVSFTFPPFCTPCLSPSAVSTAQDSAYAYLTLGSLDPGDSATNDLASQDAPPAAPSYLGALDNRGTAAATLGASYDRFDNGTFQSRTQINPKFGVMLSPWAGGLLRAAAFRTLKPEVISSQTIEPTEVAGFNQFFDDPNGATSWLYGVGFDQKVVPGIYAGAELTRRQLSYPVIGPNVYIPTRLDTFHAYADWAATDRLAMNVGFTREGLVSDTTHTPAPFNVDGAASIITDEVPVEARYFDPSGLYLTAVATFVSQTGSFLDPTGTSLAPGSSQFVTFDASIGYRLPGKLGLVAVGVTNIANQHFQFQDVDPRNPTIVPFRQLRVSATVTF